MLKRNLLYTGVTRGKRLAVLVGQKKAVAIAVRNVSGRRRWSKLDEWLAGAEDGREHGIAQGARSPQGSASTGARPYGKLRGSRLAKAGPQEAAADHAWRRQGLRRGRLRVGRHRTKVSAGVLPLMPRPWCCRFRHCSETRWSSTSVFMASASS